MRAIKKLNNNAAVCIDSDGQELVAIGKGIGFPQMPYEIVDLNQISNTFYKINPSNYNLFNEISPQIFDVAAKIAAKAKTTLARNFNPNLMISLADHINFAIIRLKNYKELKLFFSYEIEQFYPEETELGRWAVKLIAKELGVSLPDSEITSIGLHFINAQEEVTVSETKLNKDAIIDEVVQTVEDFFGVSLNKKEFSYNRFVLHVRYLLLRLEANEQFIDGELHEVLKKSYAKSYECAEQIAQKLEKYTKASLTEDEKAYLVVHIQRILQN